MRLDGRRVRSLVPDSGPEADLQVVPVVAVLAAVEFVRWPRRISGQLSRRPAERTTVESDEEQDTRDSSPFLLLDRVLGQLMRAN